MANNTVSRQKAIEADNENPDPEEDDGMRYCRRIQVICMSPAGAGSDALRNVYRSTTIWGFIRPKPTNEDSTWRAVTDNFYFKYT